MIFILIFIGVVTLVYLSKSVSDIIINPPPTIHYQDNRGSYVDNRVDNRVVLKNAKTGQTKSFRYDPNNNYYIEE